jgi:cardiolipin synthase A/B
MFEIVFDWPWFVAVSGVVIAICASGHVVLYKRESRAAVAWVGLIWLAPFIGTLLYYVFGINRIQRRARRLRRRRPHLQRTQEPGTESAEPSKSAPLPMLEKLVRHATRKHLLPGNRIQMLRNGEEAYPAMLAAIDEAQRSVSLSSYIFDNDPAGTRFVDSLQRAVARGAEARVLIDDIGVHYTWPSIQGPLRRAGVKTALFLPSFFPWYFPYANLRSHRKILVVDGRVGFTGGMNLRAGHDLSIAPRHPIQDLHFRIDGPAVLHLQEVFADDWHYTTREVLDGERWFPPLEPQGHVLARGITSGPDDDYDKMRLTFLGALSCAQSTVRIVTPYFLPDAGLISALSVAAMRGVRVDILLPEKNNLRLVQWASMAMLWQVLEHGCRVWLTPPPFDHTKLLLVDGVWTLLGSANWDARSLRLNFEFDLECYDGELTAAADEHVRKKLDKARRLTMADINRRSLPAKLRDGVARLFNPYL